MALALDKPRQPLEDKSRVASWLMMLALASLKVRGSCMGFEASRPKTLISNGSRLLVDSPLSQAACTRTRLATHPHTYIIESLQAANVCGTM
jgi:hypothetical protein